MGLEDEHIYGSEDQWARRPKNVICVGAILSCTLKTSLCWFKCNSFYRDVEVQEVSLPDISCIQGFESFSIYAHILLGLLVLH